MAKENAFIKINYFSYLIKKTHVILAIIFVIAQMVISMTSLPSGTGFYVMRWVKYGGL